MARKKQQDDRRLLCERCGYDLAGAAVGGACPECGKAVSESMPEHRTGTAWQRVGGVRGWWGTLIELVRGNRRMWEAARVDQRSGFRLAVVNAVLNGVILFLVFTIESIRHISGTTLTLTTFLSFGVLLILIVAGPTFSLTAIERRGICFFGSRRGWRVSKGVGWTVVGHASYGWLVSGVLCGVLLLPPVSSQLPWKEAQVPFLVWYLDGYFATLLGAGLVGMLVFEVWVYLGVRGMRYANPPAVTE